MEDTETIFSSGAKW